MPNDLKELCKGCWRARGLRGCLDLPVWSPLSASILPSERKARGLQSGVSVQAVEANGERINGIMTHLAGMSDDSPFNKKLRGM